MRSLRTAGLSLNRGNRSTFSISSEDQFWTFERVTYRSAGSSSLKEFLRTAVSGHYSVWESASGLFHGHLNLSTHKAGGIRSLFSAAAGLPLSLLNLQLSYMKSLERYSVTSHYGRGAASFSQHQVLRPRCYVLDHDVGLSVKPRVSPLKRVKDSYLQYLNLCVLSGNTKAGEQKKRKNSPDVSSNRHLQIASLVKISQVNIKEPA